MLAIQSKCMVDEAGSVVKGARILVENGKIAAYGPDITCPADAEYIDASALWVTPGLIEVHAHAAAEMDDLNELSTPFTADIRAFDAIDPFMEDIPVMRRAGFTTICVLPGSGNLIGGSGVVIKTKPGKTVYDIAVYDQEPLKMALGENPVRIYGAKQQMPITRMACLAMIRRTFSKARNYWRDKQAGKDVAEDLEMEALIPALKGEKRVRIHCHRAEDIVSAIRFSREFGLDCTLEHTTQGDRVAQWLGEQDVPCVVGPILLETEKRELEGIGPHVPGILEKAGVELAITSDDNRGAAYLPMTVGRCVACGLSWKAGIRSLTSTAAKILRIENRTGAIKAGLDADLAFFNGDPLLNTTRCVGTMIDGVFCERTF